MDTMMTALLGPSGCIAGDRGGVLEKGYSSPEIFMMASMLSDPLDRARLQAVGSTVSAEERQAMFFRMDEAQTIEAATEAVITGYTALFEKHPSLKQVLKETGTRMIAYQSGFRDMLLNLSSEGYGYNIVGRTLEGMRHRLQEKKKTKSHNGFTELESPLTIGLVVLCIRVCWELLITGQDSLKGFLGKSGFEILALCGVNYTETTLRSMHQAWMTRSFHCEHLEIRDIDLLVEYEFRYPGNLVGFLRKRGIHYHMESLRGAVYRTLWLEMGDKVMAVQHPAVAPELRAVSILASTSPGTVDRAGPKLLSAWVRGKIVVDDAHFKDKVSAILDTRILMDALQFVPKFYPLQNESTTTVFPVFDFYDVEDSVDMISPNFPTNLVLDGGLEFPTILHYVYFRIVLGYFSSLKKKEVYDLCMQFPSSHSMDRVDMMKTQLDTILRDRRRELLMEGVRMRVRSNPVLLQPVTFFGLENDIHVEVLSEPNFPEATATALSFCVQRASFFPELDLVFTSFHKTVHGSTNLTPNETQIIFRVWTDLYERLMTWTRFVQKLYPRSHDNWTALFFETFSPELVSLLRLPSPADAGIDFHSAEMVESMAAYFLSFTEPACKSIMSRIQPLWTPYAVAYITSLSLYKKWSDKTLNVPQLLLCPPQPPEATTGSTATTATVDLSAMTKAVVQNLKPLWDYFHDGQERTRQVWDDRWLLLVAWMVAGRPVRDHLVPLKRYMVEESRLNIRQLAVHRDLETGDETMVPIPTVVIKRKKKEVDLIMSSRFPTKLVEEHLAFLSDHPSTLLRLSYLIPDIMTVHRINQINPEAARVFAAQPPPDTHIRVHHDDDQD